MRLPTLDLLDLKDKRVLVRGDLDAEPGSRRLEALVNTISKILEKDAKQVVIMGHRGRPHFAEGSIEGKSEELSTKLFINYFQEKLNQEVEFVEDVMNFTESEKKVRLLENLRFWPGEEENSEDFAKKLASFGDIYVNEAFGNSHREHASMIGLPRLLPCASGFWLAREIEHLSKVLKKLRRPVVFIISGVKEDKAQYVEKFKKIANKVLVGGRLPLCFPDNYKDPKVLLARLTPDNKDITMRYIEHFEAEVKKAGTVVISGPIGKFEDPGHKLGTERVFKAVAESDCYSVAGGGNTEAALQMLGLAEKIDWISTGGGAMLEFLAEGTLPGIEVLK